MLLLIIMNSLWKYIIAISITAVVVHIGTYSWVNNKAKSDQKELNNQLSNLQSKENNLIKEITLINKIIQADANDQTMIHVALLSYQGANLIGNNDPLKITSFKTSGDYARFSAVATSAQLDPTVGYAKKVNGNWQILVFGTGGDPTKFYTDNNIPQDLRDTGY